MDQYLRQTLDSIVSQGYGNLELIVIDGGSSDGTCDIIHDYEKHITHFICEPDHGQYHAINKGLDLCTGDVVAWLNADDLYLPWTLSSVNKIFSSQPDFDWICGLPSFASDDSSAAKTSSKNGAKIRRLIRNGSYRNSFLGFLQQESMFWRRDLLQAVGKLSADYSLAADFEYWTRLATHAELGVVDFPLACFRLRYSSRSVIQIAEYEKEVREILKKKGVKRGLISVLSECNLFTRYISRLCIFGRVNGVRLNIQTKQLERFSRYRSVSNYSLFDVILEAIHSTKLLIRRKTRVH
jgi:glycosyltransferase involved in cell wall biosynthesis